MREVVVGCALVFDEAVCVLPWMALAFEGITLSTQGNNKVDIMKADQKPHFKTLMPLCNHNVVFEKVLIGILI